MTSPKNWTPPWRSFQQTGDPGDVVSAPEVAAAIGQKVDSVNGQASGLEMDENSTWGGHALSDFLPKQPATALSSVDGATGTQDGSLSSIVALDADRPASPGTGVVRVDVYETDWSDFGRSSQLLRLSIRSQTLRSWARERQRQARQIAGAAA